ncbi:MAG: transglycosylase SLT domain-containing protein [Bacteroidales bacterium]|nr:transglycosylase SLT domain-containing protein [Bacteroidales bacterium]
MNLLFIDSVKSNRAAFAAKVIQIANALKIDPNWLMVVMKFESGFNPAIVNPKGGATGLIQFMPATARMLGTTTASLAKMSNVRQLDYVYKYYKPAAGRIANGLDLYLYTFFPIAVGKPDNWVLQSKDLKAGTIAKVNKIFDLNNDYKITAGEFRTSVYTRLSRLIKDENTLQLFSKKKTVQLVSIIILSITAAYLWNAYSKTSKQLF